MTVNRELRVGATQSPDFLKLARERSGGTRVRCLRLSSLSDLPGLSWHSSLNREEELDAALRLVIKTADASKRVVPRRGNPPSLY
ncbi:hypothetical protein BJP50_11035 [Paenibacillus odorifer]|nr:hypothetical protein PODO_04970 [Paenibacillus odorifer]OMD06445.1 hypothetical protein BJP50_11035 [Paenibacillus odorifer]